jgi:arginase family enzyme
VLPRNSSFLPGAAGAPFIIRETFFSPANNTFGELGFDVASCVIDFGDVRPDHPDREGMLEAVTPTMRDIVSTRGLRPLSLGGDHSVTYPLTKALRDEVFECGDFGNLNE